jgi:predicted Rdx family selenoprotein
MERTQELLETLKTEYGNPALTVHTQTNTTEGLKVMITWQSSRGLTIALGNNLEEALRKVIVYEEDLREDVRG